jgi:integrase
MTRSTRGGLYKRGHRWWGDFRIYADAGGAQEPLVAEGAKLATTDRTLARQLYAERVKHLEQARRDRVVLGVSAIIGLEAFAARHLVDMAKAGRTTDDWLAYHQTALERAVAFFGRDRTLTSIGVKDVKAYVQHLATLPSGRKAGTLSPGSQRATLNCLSKLFRVAVSEGVALANPVAGLLDKPRGEKREAQWLEVHECALLLESARTLPPSPEPDALAAAFAYPLLATYLLSGARSAEVLGLRVADVSLARNIIHIRPHQDRRLKTATSHRVVPLWPQLREILSAYLFAAGDAPADDALLFPSPVTGQMIKDWRKTLDRIAVRAGFPKGSVRTKAFRHSYASARLQTVENGAPVAIWTVSRELGHGSDSMLRTIYGHLGQIRHRSQVLEYRIEQHREALADRLTALGV